VKEGKKLLPGREGGRAEPQEKRLKEVKSGGGVTSYYYLSSWRKCRKEENRISEKAHRPLPPATLAINLGEKVPGEERKELPGFGKKGGVTGSGVKKHGDCVRQLRVNSRKKQCQKKKKLRPQEKKKKKRDFE